jgi:predicted Zn-dependent protease with MMP-like domain/predicted Zn-dependent protease
MSRDAIERGWALLQDGDIGGARRAARQAARADPGSPEPLLLEAACEREEGHLPEAETLLRKATRADPDWATPVLWLAEVLADDPGRHTEALRHARRAAGLAQDDETAVDEWFGAMMLTARLELAGDDEEAARETGERLAAADEPPDNPAIALDIADLLLELGDAAAARARYQALTRSHPELAEAWHGLGLAADAVGDEPGKVAAWLEVLRLDLAAPIDEDPARLTEEEFVEVAEAALEELPGRARALLEDVPILVADVPSEEDVRAGLDPRLLGLFTGLPYPDHSALGGPPQLTQILLFRRNLERVAADVDELREEIRITLVHETGHFFGLSEDELHEMGLG